MKLAVSCAFWSLIWTLLATLKCPACGFFDTWLVASLII